MYSWGNRWGRRHRANHPPTGTIHSASLDFPKHSRPSCPVTDIYVRSFGSPRLEVFLFAMIFFLDALASSSLLFFLLYGSIGRVLRCGFGFVL